MLGYVNNGIRKHYVIKVSCVFTGLFSREFSFQQIERYFQLRGRVLSETSDLHEWYNSEVKEKICSLIKHFEENAYFDWRLNTSTNIVFKISKYF